MIVGIVALIGGIHALRARFWGFALAGGIALISLIFLLSFGEPMGIPDLGVLDDPISAFGRGMLALGIIIFGIPGTIFIAIAKRKGKFKKAIR